MLLSQKVCNNKNNTNIGSSINLKPLLNVSLLFNQFNDLSWDLIIKDPENMTDCKYYDIDEIQKIKTTFIPSKCIFSQQKLWWPRIS